MTLTDVGNLMLIHFDEIEPGNPIEIHEYVIQFAAKQLGPEGRNWVPVIVKETGPDRYQVIGNSFIYAVAAEAGLEKVWCIIAEDSPDAVKISQALAQETQPKTNLSIADRDEIAAALDYLIKQPGTPLKGVRVASVVARLDEAPREYWKDLKPITKLGCGITGGAKLKALEQIFYLTPQPIPEITMDTHLLEMMTTGELTAIAKKRGFTGLGKSTKPDLVKLLSESSEIQESRPKTNLSTADRDEITAALDYLIKQPGTPLKGVRVASVVARLDEAPREYWKDLKPITKLSCGITGGAKLKALEQIFYLTPQSIPEITTDTRLLEMMAVGELKAMAKKKGLTGFAKMKKPDLVKLLSEASE